MEIFVFGSNQAGRHGKGAARHAYERYGAQLGVGEGLTGRSYAIPTKDRRLAPLPLCEVEAGIERFVRFARSNPGMRFMLTPVGCGLAGHKRADIWRALKRVGLPSNVFLTSSWLDS